MGPAEINGNYLYLQYANIVLSNGLYIEIHAFEASKKLSRPKKSSSSSFSTFMRQFNSSSGEVLRKVLEISESSNDDKEKEIVFSSHAELLLIRYVGRNRLWKRAVQMI